MICMKEVKTTERKETVSSVLSLSTYDRASWASRILLGEEHDPIDFMLTQQGVDAMEMMLTQNKIRWNMVSTDGLCRYYFTLRCDFLCCREFLRSDLYRDRCVALIDIVIKGYFHFGGGRLS